MSRLSLSSSTACSLRQSRTVSSNPAVRLGLHDDVVGRGSPEAVQAHPVGAVGRVRDGVEEGRRVRGPRTPVVGPLDLVGEVATGREVSGTGGEDLVAGGVDGVGQQVLVGTRRPESQVEVAGARVEAVDVQDDHRTVGGSVAGHGPDSGFRGVLSRIVTTFSHQLAVVPVLASRV